MELTALSRLSRFKEIILVLLKYGFHDVVERLNLPSRVLAGAKAHTKQVASPHERIRLMLEELGPSFVKLGQMLSLRPDLVPYDLTVELGRLRDQVAPADVNEIKKTLVRDLGRPLEEVFSEFEDSPLAAASLAHVHRAVLRHENIPVAVKVQRPHIRKTLENDLAIIEKIVNVLDNRVEELHYYDLPGIYRELKHALLNEIDFSLEARNMLIARENTVHTPHIRIPRIYENYCTKNVLTMELLVGRKLPEAAVFYASARENLARIGLGATIEQILHHGFFHADPHPGNIIVLDEQNIGLLDWGMVGRLTRTSRWHLVDLIGAVVDKDSERVVQVILQICETGDAPDLSRLEREVMNIIDHYFSGPLKDVQVGRLLISVMNVVREEKLALPPELAMTLKAILTVEATARMIDPDLNVVAEAGPYVRKLILERYEPRAVLRSARNALVNFWYIQKRFPGRFDRILEKLEKGDIRVRFGHENLTGLMDTIQHGVNRLAFAVIIGALILGSSIIITTGVKPLLFGYPAIGIVGYILSALLGLWLVFDIIMHRVHAPKNKRGRL